MLHYITIFLIAAIVSYAITPLIIKLAFYVKAVDIPKDKRRIHTKPMPRMGGASIYISFLLCTLFFLRLDKQLIGIILGGSIMLVMGIFDDIFQLKALPKLMIQIFAAMILIIFGVTVRSVTIPFIVGDGSVGIHYIGIPLTVLWVVGITNAINLVDGLDGLACGISMISALTLFGVSIISTRYMAVFLTVMLSGACIGFLPYNFYPARIFIGDTGSQFLGFMLAAISIQGAIKSATAVAVAVPVLALGLPIYDTLFAIIRRKINKRPIMEADRGHLHHRLLDTGLSHRQVVLIMYTISAILGGTSIVAMIASVKKSFALLIAVCAVIIAIGIEMGLFSNKTKNGI